MNLLGTGREYVAFAGKTKVYAKKITSNDAKTCGDSPVDIVFPVESELSEWISKGGRIECIAMSSDDKNIAVADSLHGLHLFELESSEEARWIRIFQETSNKRVIKLQFTSDGKFLTFLDKQGDIFAIPISRERSVKKIMGHTSFISDYVTRNDSMQIVSCDRDEKIRISNFPDAFVIQGFNLGHTESVINVAFLYVRVNDVDHTYLLSMSISGVLILWDFDKPIVGTKTDYLKKWNLRDVIPAEMKDYDVKCMKVSTCGDKANLCISFTGSTKILIWTISLGNLEIKLIQELETQSDCHMIEWSSGNQLLIYAPDLGCVNWWSADKDALQKDGFSFNEGIVSDIKALTDCLKPSAVPMKKRITNYEEDAAAALIEEHSIKKKVKS